MAPPDDIASAVPALAHDPAPDPAAQEAARNHALRMGALEAVIDHGLGLLDEIRRRTVRDDEYAAETHKPEPADLGLAFDRISRAVRFTVAQHERLEIEAAKSVEQRQAEAAARAAAEAQRLAKAVKPPSPEQQAQDRKLRLVERAVRRAIENTEDYDEHDTLLEDLHERLEEVEDLGLDRPIGAVVAGICRAMRLPFDLALWRTSPGRSARPRTSRKARPMPNGGAAPMTAPGNAIPNTAVHAAASGRLERASISLVSLSAVNLIKSSPPP